MSLSQVGSFARKDLRRLAQDRLALLLWLGIPLAVGAMLTLVTGGSEGLSPKARVWWVNEDDGFLSDFLGAALGGAEVIEAEEVASVEEGRRRILDGDGSAVLVIPAGFGDALLNEEDTALRLITNPSQRILPGIVEESLEMLSEASFYLHRVLGEELRAAFRPPDEGEATLPDREVAAISIAINEIVREIEQTLLPPVTEVVTESTRDDEPAGAADSTPFSLLFLPGILCMAMFFAAQGMSEDLWKEKDEGTLRRGLGTPTTAARLLAGKVLACGALLGTVALVALGVGTAYHGLSWARLPVAVLWTTLAGIGAYLGFVLLLSFAGSRRGSSILANALLLPMLMLGGSFFPMEIMPEWMAAIGQRTPNGFAVVRLSELLRDPPATASLMGAFAGGLALLVVLGGLAVRRLPGFAGVER